MSTLTLSFAPEASRMGIVAEDCDCCVRGCCDYCRVQIAWTVVCSASRTVGAVVETISWNVSLNMTWLRNDDVNAPVFPKTFRSVESVGLERCELLPNSGPFEHLINGSYTYIKTDTGIEVDREEVDLTPWLSVFHVRIDCACTSLEYAGTTHPTTGEPIPTTTLSFYLEGDPGPGGPSTLPAEWSGYFSGIGKTFDNIANCRGTDTIIDSTPVTFLSGAADTSSRTDVTSVIVTECTPVESNDMLEEGGGRILMETGDTLIL